MLTFFDSTSDFSIAFMKSLIHSLWIGAILVLIVKALLLFIRDNHSGVRYWISTSGLLIFVLATGVLFTQLFAPSLPSELVLSDTSLKTLFLLAASKASLGGDLSSIEVYYPILLKIYLLGLLLFTIRWIVSVFQIRSIINKGDGTESATLALLESLKLKLGIKMEIKLISSTKLGAPVLYGFLKPVIIVPAGMFFNLPHKQVESILMHELIHVKRLDFFVNLLQSVVELIFFFNPFIWVMSKQIRIEREKYCDDLVVDSGSSPSVYAKALLNLSLLQSNRYDLAIPATGSNRQVLLNRIQRLLNINTMKTRNKRRVFLTYLVVVSFIVLLISSGFRSAFFTIDKGGNGRLVPTESSKRMSLTGTDDAVDFAHHIHAASDPVSVIVDDHELCMQDTSIVVDLDSMSDEEWEVYRQELEEGYEELKNMDWEAEEAEFEKNKQEMLADLDFDREHFEKDIQMAREEIKNLNKEKIILELQEAKVHMDTIKHDLDWEKMEQDLELAREDIELAIQEMHLHMQDSAHFLQDAHEAMQHSLHELQEIDLEEIMKNVEEAMVDIDLDFDFDFDFDHTFNINFDSIMNEAQISIEEIDFEEIRQNIEEAMQKMEIEMQEMDERRKENKEK
jgi:bla regulator protein blaR1